MPTAIHRNIDNTITVSFTFPPSKSMREIEFSLQDASNKANAIASGECLKPHDSDGSPIYLGGQKLTSKGLEPKDYQPPYGPVSVERHTYQRSSGGAT